MRIAINGKPLASHQWRYVQELLMFLTEQGIDYVLKRSFAFAGGHAGIKYDFEKTFTSYRDLPDCEMLISIGGDGTLLESVTFIREKEIPILCVNAGRLGFLSTTQLESILMNLHKVLNNEYSIDKRSLIRVESNMALFNECNFALNEFAITKANNASMIMVHTFVDNQFLNTYWADGLILATPTGSTGYSLSCGGPIIMPHANNFVLTAVSPHNLTVRPVVLPDNAVITFKPEVRDGKYLLSVDSRSQLIEHSLTITAKKEKFEALLIRLQDDTFFDTLRSKLNWGIDNRN